MSIAKVLRDSLAESDSDKLKPFSSKTPLYSPNSGVCVELSRVKVSEYQGVGPAFLLSIACNENILARTITKKQSLDHSSPEKCLDRTYGCDCCPLRRVRTGCELSDHPSEITVQLDEYMIDIDCYLVLFYPMVTLWKHIW